MQRRLWIAGSLGLLAGGTLGQVVGAQEEGEVPTAAQLDPRLSVGELKDGFASALETVGGEKFGGKLADMVRQLDVERLRTAIASAGRSTATIFKHERFSNAFRWSLEMDLRVFEAVQEAVARSQPVVLGVLNNVTSAATDLALKAGALTKNGTGDVGVTVHTMKSGGEEQGCRVYYAPFMHDDLQHRVRFDKFSSPTTDTMPAGKWWIWAAKNQQEGPKDEFRCGDDQRPQRTIHIDAP